jgi:hypothetical protein
MKRHLVVDANGTPLGCVLFEANRHDSQMLEQTLNAVPNVHTEHGVPLAFDLTNSTPIKGMIRRVAVSNCAKQELFLASLVVASITAKRWGITAGSLSAPSLGSIVSDASKCAMNHETSFT